MAKYRQVPWNKTLFDEFCKNAMLTNEEIYIMKNRIMNDLPQSIVADNLGISVSTLGRKIKKLKAKYDDTAKNSDILPRRIE